jgi:peptide/nickel transport system permease protein
MMGGAVIVERVFAVPGIGNKIVDSINHRDMPTLLACTMILSIFTIVMQLVIDLCYVLVDPRIKSSFTGKKLKRAKTEGLRLLAGNGGGDDVRSNG